MYKLIALDMDGTLLNSDGAVSSGNATAILAAQRKGIKVVLTTGRPPKGVARFFEQLNMLGDDDYVIGCNGARTEKTKSHEIIALEHITAKDFKRLYAIAEEHGLICYAFGKDYIVSPLDHPMVHIEGNSNDTDVRIIPLAEISDDFPILKIMFTFDFRHFKPTDGLHRVMAETPQDAWKDIIPNFPDFVKKEFSAMQSASIFYEFLPKGVTKATGVAALAKHLGITQQEVICMGDSGNDIHMVEWAGTGVAMANAVQGVKDVAAFVSKSNDEDGVAHAINTLVLQN